MVPAAPPCSDHVIVRVRTCQLSRFCPETSSVLVVRLQVATAGGGIERVGTPHIFFGQHLQQGPVEGVVQEYDPPTLPCGFIFR